MAGENMTEQQEKEALFRIAWNHLKAQGRRSVDLTSGDCVYLASGGEQCAAGPFVIHGANAANRLGQWDMVLNSLEYDRGDIEVDPLSIRHQELVLQLQSAHDDSMELEGVFRTLSKVAVIHGLPVSDLLEAA